MSKWSPRASRQSSWNGTDVCSSDGCPMGKPTTRIVTNAHPIMGGRLAPSFDDRLREHRRIDLHVVFEFLDGDREGLDRRKTLDDERHLYVIDVAIVRKVRYLFQAADVGNVERDDRPDGKVGLRVD